MDDEDSDHSSEATQFEILTRDPNQQQDFYDFDDDELHDFDDNNQPDDDDDDDVSQLHSMEIDSYSATFQSQTLAASSSSGLADVPIQYEVREDELEDLKNQLQGSHQEALAIVIAQAAQAHTRNNKVSSPGVPCSSLEQSPPVSSHPVNSQEDTPSTERTPLNICEENQKTTSDSKTITSSRTVKTPVDGYNWRKYGQKQVKSPQGSRSYYKCSYNDCDAKKIESSDQYNFVTKIVYRGQHEHDPPKKVYTKRGKKSRGQITRKYKSSDAVPILVEEMDAPPPKRRVVKKSGLALPSSVPKRPKKPKFVIHAASDVGISADGYRWRKYGQKMVKGNPHPRNYYKCTSAGCPVRKHIELAVDGSAEVILTYKGIHDHDMPVRGKDQGPPSVLLLNAVSSPSKNNSLSRKGETNPPINGVVEKSSLEVR